MIRFLHKVYAHVNGYFWLPCPICGRMFGGHEKKGDLMIDWSRGKAVCSNCIDRANERNRIWMEAHPFEETNE